jgi:CO/xanthine dehydrogenase FAD-binding subunit
VLVLSGVAPVPLRAAEAEAYLKGKELKDEVVDAAAELAVKSALPLRFNNYKVQEVKAMLKGFLQSI